MDSPAFSNILEKETFMGYNKYKNIDKLYFELYYAKEFEQAKIEALINSHITKIVRGLSSNSDW